MCSFGCAPFLYTYRRDICFGNGEYEFECCCDECDYYLLCFPEFNLKNRKEDIDMAICTTDGKERF